MAVVHLEAALLDRDGTINVKAEEGEYITRPEQLELLPGAAVAIRALNRRRIPVVVLTNQRGIALGRMTEDDLEAVHRRLHELLRASGAKVDAIFHCPHHEGTCGCRKPGPLLLERAREHLGLVSFARTVMIGDSSRDVMAGRAVGARTVLVGRDRGEHGPGDTAETLLDAVSHVLAMPLRKRAFASGVDRGET